MNLIFYKTKSEHNRLTKVLTDSKAITGNLQTDVDIDNPVIVISLENSVINHNYCYIEAFNRYYYITKIEVTNKNIKVYLHIDVLMSFRTDILNSKAHITRSNRGNLYLKDSLAYTTAKPVIQYKNLGTCFTSQATYIMVKGGQ